MTHAAARLSLPVALLALGHLACGDYVAGADGDRDADDSGLDAVDSASGDDDTAGGHGGGGLDGTWGLAGELRLVDGQPSLEASALLLETRGVTCEVPARLATVGALEPLPDGAVVGWTLTVEPSPEATCAWVGPTTLRVGLGALDPQLRPAADRLDAPWEGSYGLYLGGPRGTVWLVGLAHPDAAADTDGPDTDGADSDTDGGGLLPTLPTDAEYALVTLHGIPLAP